MWTVFVFLLLGVLHYTVSSSPPKPNKVSFSSENLKNVLHWFPGNGTPSDTHFTVQYAVYGDSVEGSKGKRVHWKAVPQCTGISRTWCDLSNETWDEEQGYYGRVRAVGKNASSKWALTQRRFDPKLDTTFGPPLVSVEIVDNNAIITLMGPMRYQPKNHSPVVSLAKFYPQMIYSLSIQNVCRNQTHNFLVDSGPSKYELMEYNTKYCFSGKARFLTIPIHCQSSEWYCINTPPDPVINQLYRLVLAIVVPSLCVCVLMVVGYFLCNYLMGRGQKSPYTLNPPSFHSSPLTFPEVENLNIVLITLEPQSDTDPACPPRLGSTLQYADPPPRYSPQRHQTPVQPEEHFSDSSVDYGVLGIAPKNNPIREEGDLQKRRDRREDGNNLNDKCQRCTAEDSYERKQWRGKDGQLTGFYDPQAKSYLPLKSTHICTQPHMQIQTQSHVQLEMSTLAQARGLSQSQLDRDTEDSLFINKNPQTGLFHIPLNVQTSKEVGKGEDVEEKVNVRTDGTITRGVGEGSNSEKVPLLSAYASQGVVDMRHLHTELSDSLLDDYGIVRMNTAHSVDEDDDNNEEEEEGTICINWNPEDKKLILPEMAMTPSTQGELGSEDRIGGDDEKEEVTMGRLRLENVFVRQPSEEDAVRETERGGATGWEVDDFATKWNLVIPLDE